MLNSAVVKRTHFKGSRVIRTTCVLAPLKEETITQLENKEEKLEHSSDLIRMASFPHLKCSNGCLGTPKYKL